MEAAFYLPPEFGCTVHYFVRPCPTSQSQRERKFRIHRNHSSLLHYFEHVPPYVMYDTGQAISLLLNIIVLDLCASTDLHT